MYPLTELNAPPEPPAITEAEFNTSVAHVVERHSSAYYEHWLGVREISGDIMEYQFRLRFPIPIHLPRSAMKLILLFIAEDDADLFGGEGIWLAPLEMYTFRWFQPFSWPPRRR